MFISSDIVIILNIVVWAQAQLRVVELLEAAGRAPACPELPRSAERIWRDLPTQCRAALEGLAALGHA